MPVVGVIDELSTFEDFTKEFAVAAANVKLESAVPALDDESREALRSTEALELAVMVQKI